MKDLMPNSSFPLNPAQNFISKDRAINAVSNPKVYVHDLFWGSHLVNIIFTLEGVQNLSITNKQSQHYLFTQETQFTFGLNRCETNCITDAYSVVTATIRASYWIVLMEMLNEIPHIIGYGYLRGMPPQLERATFRSQLFPSLIMRRMVRKRFRMSR